MHKLRIATNILSFLMCVMSILNFIGQKQPSDSCPTSAGRNLCRQIDRINNCKARRLQAMTSYGEYHVSVLELYLPSPRLVLECGTVTDQGAFKLIFGSGEDLDNSFLFVFFRYSITFHHLLYHFEITGDSCNLIGSQQCDLFTNHIWF